MTAEDWYQKGNAYRKQSDWQHALDCYMEAIALDPDSPAVVAKKMLEDILNFYHKDAYNPQGKQNAEMPNRNTGMPASPKKEKNNNT